MKIYDVLFEAAMIREEKNEYFGFRMNLSFALWSELKKELEEMFRDIRYHQKTAVVEITKLSLSNQIYEVVHKVGGSTDPDIEGVIVNYLKTGRAR